MGKASEKAELWNLVFERAQHRCEYCDIYLYRDFETHYGRELDHIHPYWRGGSDNDPENRASSCHKCNQVKQSYVPKGATRAERIADARVFIEARLASYQAYAVYQECRRKWEEAA